MTNGPPPKAPEHLDGIDLKILAELQDNGRIPINELVSRVGVSRPNGLRRLRSLLRRGVIKAIRAALDERLLGYGVMSFVSLRLDSQAEPALRAFEERKGRAVDPRWIELWDQIINIVQDWAIG